MDRPSALPRPLRRPRRLRRNETVRRLVRETRLTPDRLVLPLFVIDGKGVAEPIDAMPGHARLSIDRLVERCEEALALGVGAFALFPAVAPARKTRDAGEALNPENLLCRAVRALKDALPEAYVATDIALDPYSSLGHDGLVSPQGVVLNDETVDVLAPMAVLHGQAGADMVAPSDMMDGRVAAIRAALDAAGQTEVAILSYTAKYASGFYEPFREALDSAPVSAPNVPADKKTYQMDPANAREAIVEALLDEAEAPVPGRDPPTPRGHEAPDCRLPRERGVRHDQGGGRTGLARRAAVHDGVPARNRPGGRRPHLHLRGGRLCPLDEGRFDLARGVIRERYGIAPERRGGPSAGCGSPWVPACEPGHRSPTPAAGPPRGSAEGNVGARLSPPRARS
jgi:porphobilinogen synthase